MIARPTDFTNFGQYSKLLTIWHNQQNQDAENTKNHDDYVTAAQTWLVQADSQRAHGQPLPQKPTLPLCKTYNDDGTITETAFPDLTVPELPDPGAAAGSGSTVSKDIPMDRQDVALLLLNKICDKLGIK